jgi:hypothetical protein
VSGLEAIRGIVQAWEAMGTCERGGVSRGACLACEAVVSREEDNRVRPLCVCALWPDPSVHTKERGQTSSLRYHAP